MKKTSNIKHFIRGGQLILHNARMFKQIIMRVVLISVLLFFAINIVWLIARTTPYERYVTFKWLSAHINVLINHNAMQDFKQPDGERYPVYSKDIIHSTQVHRILVHTKQILLQGIIIGIILYFFAFLSISQWLKRRGKSHTQDNRVRGDYIDTPEVTKKIIRNKGQASNLIISKQKIPIPKFSMKQHFMFHGTPGSGKSTAIKEFLDYLRQTGDPVFLYDKGCVLTTQYYCAEKDTLLNCLDARTAAWSLWRECRDKTEFEAFAAAQIPMPLSTQDPFWVNAARTIFVAAANRMRKEVKCPRLLPLLKYLLTADLGDIKSLLRGTEAESLMSEKIEKTAISIKSVLATYLKSLCYVKEGDNPFSVREWVEHARPHQWLFVSSRGDKHETLKPLITAWIDIAINTLLSLPEDDTRRIWFILDEFTSLHQLPCITDGLSESRKFGGCFVLGLQNIAKLRKLYGVDGAKDISSLLNTRLMFRQPDPDIATWSARNLGETVLNEVNESISYGANTLRDGVSINHVERNKPVVTYSEMMNLDDLSCYLRLAGHYPITRIDFAYINRPKLNEPFIPRNIEQDDLRLEVAALIEEIKGTDTKFNKNAAKKPKSLSNKSTSTKKKEKVNAPQPSSQQSPQPSLDI